MRRSAILALSLPAIALVAGGGFLVTRTRNAVESARGKLASDAQISFRLAEFSPIRSNLVPLQAPEGYAAAAALGGKLYLAGAAGLAEYPSLDAPPTRQWHVGDDLPAAGIASMQPAHLRGASAPVLVITTHGAGVLLFDGISVRQLVLAPGYDVTTALPLPSGDLLLGTRQHGVLRYDGQHIASFHPQLEGLHVTAIAGSDGDLWIGTRDRGVRHWHAGQTETFDANAGLPDSQVESVQIDGANVYVGTAAGVQQFANGKPARVLAPGVFAHALAMQAGTLLVASIDEGIYEIPLDLRRAESPRRIESAPVAAESLFAEQGQVYAVSRAGLFRRASRGSWTSTLPAAHSLLADRNVSALQFSDDGSLWIGYFDHGMDILSPGEQRATHVEDDHVFCVNRIVRDPKRFTINVATANGLVLFDTSGHARQILTRKDGLIADQVTDVAFVNGGMAIATPAGITYADADGMQSLYAFQGLVNNHVYSLAADDQSGNLLAGTLGGVSVLSRKAVFRNISSANSRMRQNWTTAIVRLDGHWLLGTYGGGVVQMDDAGQVTPEDTSAPKAVINPNAMLVTATHVYAGTLSDGLLVYSRAARRWTRLTAGLPSLNVTAIAQKASQIYIGTENGIVKVQEESLPQ